MFASLGITSFGTMVLIAMLVPLVFSLFVFAVAVAIHQHSMHTAKENLDAWIPEPMYPYDDVPPTPEVYSLYIKRHMNVN